MDGRSTTVGAEVPPPIVLEAQSDLATDLAIFRMLTFVRQDRDASYPPIIALQCGDFEKSSRPLVRVHSKCTTSEVFGSRHCDCADQLRIAMERIVAEGTGLVIYLDQEARGNGLRAKLQIYDRMQHLGETSHDACVALGYPPDQRTYESAAAVLLYLETNRIRLLTNNPLKSEGLRIFGIDVEEAQILGTVTEFNYAYLTEKQVRFKHNLGLTSDVNAQTAYRKRP